MSGSVTISGHPILLDWNEQLREFMQERLPPEDVLFSRWMQNEVPPNPLVTHASDYLRSPYPRLPDIKIGELQWPSGASRFARALYAVDWSTMLEIAQDCWGYEKPTELIDPDGDPDDPENQREIDPVDIPEEWGIEHYPVVLSINDQEREFTADMFGLPPYRVTGNGIDLWLIPLVDERFLFNRRPHTAFTTPPEDWASLFSGLASDMGTTITADAVSANYGTPDYRLYKTDNPASELLDIAALSVGLRIVRDPSTGTMRALSTASSDTKRTTTLSGNNLLSSGGMRGMSARPKGVDIYCDRGDEQFEAFTYLLTAGGPGTVKLAVWTSWYLDYVGPVLNNSAATANFITQVGDDLESWFNSGGQYCFNGSLVYIPSGYDDFLSIQVCEVRQDLYRFNSRIYELPQVFLPSALMVNGHECKKYGRFEYQLLSNWFGGLALAYKRDMEGEDLPNPYVTIRDRLGIFSYQKKGDRGHMVLECGNYYARQAPCGNTVNPEPTPPLGSGACCVDLGGGEYGCSPTTSAECASVGGTWKGTGTVCGDLSICDP